MISCHTDARVKQQMLNLMPLFQDNVISWHQKGKLTILDFSKAKDDKDGSGNSWTINKSFASRLKQITTPESHYFLHAE